MKLFQSSVLGLVFFVTRIVAVPLEPTSTCGLDTSSYVASNQGALLLPNSLVTEAQDNVAVAHDASSGASSSLLEYGSSYHISSVRETTLSPHPLQVTATNRADSTKDTADIVARGNPHGSPYCNPTGEGVCNFAFWRAYNPEYHQVYLYNRFCINIGHKANGTPRDKQTLDGKNSELPDPIIYTINDEQFWYHNQRTGNAKGDCTTYRDYEWGAGAFIVQCAFDCGEGSWQHSDCGPGCYTQACTGNGGAD